MNRAMPMLDHAALGGVAHHHHLAVGLEDDVTGGVVAVEEVGVSLALFAEAPSRPPLTFSRATANSSPLPVRRPRPTTTDLPLRRVAQP